MGGKTGTTTQSVNIPPEVLARYNAVNARAETTAQQPFQQYGTSPESFVAQMNPQQQAGISNINQSAMAAQPAYQSAMQGTAGAYGGLTPQGFQQGVQGYMSPFLSNAMGATAAQMQNVNQQQQQDLIGNTIKSGAFGGDRGNIARANLMNQQNLAMGQTLGNMAQQGYQSAAQNYLTGVGQQGQLAAQMGALGAGAQQAGLQGAQAQIGAGTLGQQTEQAGKTALYNQFLQQQAYPFQVAQFLANVAMGTGALSGSQTTTTQPMSFFSDRRLKHDIKRIGETDEGLPIYKFKYKGDPEEQTHVGFMADEVEKIHPEAVGQSHGYKTVDYDKATSEGGAVHERHAGLGFALGGAPSPMDYGTTNPYDPNSIQNIIARQQAMFATPESHYVPLARQITGGFGKHSRVPEANLAVGQLMRPSAPPSQLPSTFEQGMEGIQKGKAISDFFSKDDKGKPGMGRQILDWMSQDKKSTEDARNAGATTQPPAKTSPSAKITLGELEDQDIPAATGGAIHGYAAGGLTPETQKEDTPEGLYSSEQTGKLNIPIESKDYKLLQQSTLPGSMQDPTMRDIMTIVGMFKADGGRAGYADGGDIDNYLTALRKIESSHNYEALGPMTKKGDRAYGAYQVMGANVPSWTKEAVGRSMSPDEFLADKEAQDTTARHFFGKALNKYGTPQDAASVWFTGKPLSQNTTGTTDQYTTLPKYVQRFNKAAGLGQTAGLDMIGGNDQAPSWYNPTRTASYEGLGGAKYAANEPQTMNDATQEVVEEPKKGGLAPAARGDVGNVGATESGAYSDISQQVGPLGKQFKKAFGEDFPTSENIWVPAVAGLGAMLSSRSPFLLPAVGEGLLGATSAYTALNEQQPRIAGAVAEVPQTRAVTEGVKAKTAGTWQDIAKGSMYVSPTGETWLMGINPDGTYGWVPEAKAREMIEAGTLKVDPRQGVQFSTQQQTNKPEGIVGPGRGAPPPGPPKEGLNPETPVTPVTPAATTTAQTGPLSLSDEDKNLIESETKTLGTKGPLFAKQSAQSTGTESLFATLNDSGAAANDTAQPLMQFASELSVRKNWQAGPQGAALEPAAALLNGVARALDLKEPFKPGAVANTEAIKKAHERLTTDAANLHNQRAVAALAEFGNMFPAFTSSPEGAATNAADVLVNNRMASEMKNIGNQWLDIAKKKDIAVAGYTGGKFSEWFHKKMDPIYNQDRQNLKRMFLEPVGENRVDPETGAPLTWMRYMSTYYNQFSPEDQKKIRELAEKKFGKHTLEYFTNVR